MPEYLPIDYLPSGELRSDAKDRTIKQYIPSPNQGQTQTAPTDSQYNAIMQGLNNGQYVKDDEGYIYNYTGDGNHDIFPLGKLDYDSQGKPRFRNVSNTDKGFYQGIPNWETPATNTGSLSDIERGVKSFVRSMNPFSMANDALHNLFNSDTNTIYSSKQNFEKLRPETDKAKEAQMWHELFPEDNEYIPASSKESYTKNLQSVGNIAGQIALAVGTAGTASTFVKTAQAAKYVPAIVGGFSISAPSHLNAYATGDESAAKAITNTALETAANTLAATTGQLWANKLAGKASTGLGRTLGYIAGDVAGNVAPITSQRLLQNYTGLTPKESLWDIGKESLANMLIPLTLGTIPAVRGAWSRYKSAPHEVPIEAQVAPKYEQAPITDPLEINRTYANDIIAKGENNQLGRSFSTAVKGFGEHTDLASEKAINNVEKIHDQLFGKSEQPKDLGTIYQDLNEVFYGNRTSNLTPEKLTQIKEANQPQEMIIRGKRQMVKDPTVLLAEQVYAKDELTRTKDYIQQKLPDVKPEEVMNNVLKGIDANTEGGDIALYKSIQKHVNKGDGVKGEEIFPFLRSRINDMYGIKEEQPQYQPSNLTKYESKLPMNQEPVSPRSQELPNYIVDDKGVVWKIGRDGSIETVGENVPPEQLQGRTLNYLPSKQSTMALPEKSSFQYPKVEQGTIEQRPTSISENLQQGYKGNIYPDRVSKIELPESMGLAKDLPTVTSAQDKAEQAKILQARKEAYTRPIEQQTEVSKAPETQPIVSEQPYIAQPKSEIAKEPKTSPIEAPKRPLSGETNKVLTTEIKTPEKAPIALKNKPEIEVPKTKGYQKPKLKIDEPEVRNKFQEYEENKKTYLEDNPKDEPNKVFIKKSGGIDFADTVEDTGGKEININRGKLQGSDGKNISFDVTTKEGIDSNRDKPRINRHVYDFPRIISEGGTKVEPSKRIIAETSVDKNGVWHLDDLSISGKRLEHGKTFEHEELLNNYIENAVKSEYEKFISTQPTQSNAPIETIAPKEKVITKKKTGLENLSKFKTANIFNEMRTEGVNTRYISDKTKNDAYLILPDRNVKARIKFDESGKAEITNFISTNKSETLETLQKFLDDNKATKKNLDKILLKYDKYVRSNDDAMNKQDVIKNNPNISGIVRSVIGPAMMMLPEDKDGKVLGIDKKYWVLGGAALTAGSLLHYKADGRSFLNFGKFGSARYSPSESVPFSANRLLNIKDNMARIERAAYDDAHEGQPRIIDGPNKGKYIETPETMAKYEQLKQERTKEYLSRNKGVKQSRTGRLLNKSIPAMAIDNNPIGVALEKTFTLRNSIDGKIAQEYYDIKTPIKEKFKTQFSNKEFSNLMDFAHSIDHQTSEILQTTKSSESVKDAKISKITNDAAIRNRCQKEFGENWEKYYNGYKDLRQVADKMSEIQLKSRLMKRIKEDADVAINNLPTYQEQLNILKQNHADLLTKAEEAKSSKSMEKQSGLENLKSTSGNIEEKMNDYKAIKSSIRDAKTKYESTKDMRQDFVDKYGDKGYQKYVEYRNNRALELKKTIDNLKSNFEKKHSISFDDFKKDYSNQKANYEQYQKDRLSQENIDESRSPEYLALKNAADNYYNSEVVPVKNKVDNIQRTIKDIQKSQDRHYLPHIDPNGTNSGYVLRIIDVDKPVNERSMPAAIKFAKEFPSKKAAEKYFMANKEALGIKEQLPGGEYRVEREVMNADGNKELRTGRVKWEVYDQNNIRYTSLDQLKARVKQIIGDRTLTQNDSKIELNKLLDDIQNSNDLYSEQDRPNFDDNDNYTETIQGLKTVINSDNKENTAKELLKVLNRISMPKSKLQAIRKNFEGWKPEDASSWLKYIDSMDDVVNNSTESNTRTEFLKEIDNQIDNSINKGFKDGALKYLEGIQDNIINRNATPSELQAISKAIRTFTGLSSVGVMAYNVASAIKNAVVGKIAGQTHLSYYGLKPWSKNIDLNIKNGVKRLANGATKIFPNALMGRESIEKSIDGMFGWKNPDVNRALKSVAHLIDDQTVSGTLSKEVALDGTFLQRAYKFTMLLKNVSEKLVNLDNAANFATMYVRENPITPEMRTNVKEYNAYHNDLTAQLAAMIESSNYAPQMELRLPIEQKIISKLPAMKPLLTMMGPTILDVSRQATLYSNVFMGSPEGRKRFAPAIGHLLLSSILGGTSYSIASDILGKTLKGGYNLWNIATQNDPKTLQSMNEKLKSEGTKALIAQGMDEKKAKSYVNQISDVFEYGIPSVLTGLDLSQNSNIDGQIFSVSRISDVVSKTGKAFSGKEEDLKNLLKFAAPSAVKVYDALKIFSSGETSTGRKVSGTEKLLTTGKALIGRNLSDVKATEAKASSEYPISNVEQQRDYAKKIVGNNLLTFQNGIKKTSDDAKDYIAKFRNRTMEVKAGADDIMKSKDFQNNISQSIDKAQSIVNDPRFDTAIRQYLGLDIVKHYGKSDDNPVEGLKDKIKQAVVNYYSADALIKSMQNNLETKEAVNAKIGHKDMKVVDWRQALNSGDFKNLKQYTTKSSSIPNNIDRAVYYAITKVYNSKFKTNLGEEYEDNSEDYKEEAP